MSTASRATPAARLDALLRPRAVAIIGASADSTKRGYQIIRALQASRYAGTIYAVNPRGGDVLGVHVYESVAALPAAPDLAVLCTPARTVPEALRQCAARGVAAAVVLALGFAEAGAEGEALEAEVRDIARRSGIRVLGPNTSGLLNLSIGLNLIGMRDVPHGPLALVAQSGNVVLEQVTRASSDSGAGFNVCVGLGNLADVAWHDVLLDLAQDDAVRAIAMYAESLGDGRAFVGAATHVARKVPLALLKGGRSSAGLQAARSHTGALATEAAVLQAALRAAGVISVARSDELRIVSTALAWQRAARSGGVAVLSDGGGHGTLAADTLIERRVPLAQLTDETQLALRELLGSAAAVTNPVDVAGATDRNPTVFAEALRRLADDDGVGALLLVGLFGGYAIRFDTQLAAAECTAAQTMVDVARASGRPLVVHSLYHGVSSEPLRLLSQCEIPVTASLENACAAVAALVQRRTLLERQPHQPLPRPAHTGARIVAAARNARRNTLNEAEARTLAERHDVPLVPATHCTTRAEAAAAVRALGVPVAVRLLSDTILHKTGAGGVRLDVRDAAAAERAFDDVTEAATAWALRHGIDASIRGVLVSPMLETPLAELIIGARRDGGFGPLLAVGMGGVDVEATPDVVLRLLPVTREDVLSALDELRGNALLRGVRGRPGAHLDAIVACALALGDCLLHNPELSEIEANPVLAYADRAIAVDVRALLAEA